MQMFNALRENALAISLFAIVTAALIAVTKVSTADRIVHNEKQQQAKALYEIVPRSLIENDLLADTLTLPSEGLTDQPELTVHQAKKNGEVIAVIFPVVANDGYSGKIRMIVGINADSSVAGVRVLAHKETPGLGDKIDTKKSDWILSFNGKVKLGFTDSSWAVKKDGGQFDQFTGATITPRAVVNAVGQAIDYFLRHQVALMAAETKVVETAQEVTGE